MGIIPHDNLATLVRDLIVEQIETSYPVSEGNDERFYHKKHPLVEKLKERLSVGENTTSIYLRGISEGVINEYPPNPDIPFGVTQQKLDKLAILFDVLDVSPDLDIHRQIAARYQPTELNWQYPPPIQNP